MLHAHQRAVVDRLVERCVGRTSYDREVAASLYELLIPKALKTVLNPDDDIELCVDEGSARFPWEMLLAGADAQESGSTGGCVVRHLLNEDTAVGPEPVLDLARALVIGDPITDFVALPGAREEARQVADVLQTSGIRVTSQINGSGEDAIVALFSDLYQLLHLAGNGVVNALLPETPDERMTGFILGKNMVLTSVEIAQMRKVPLVAFINACHLGRVTDHGDTSDSRALNRFAASLVSQFIRQGARIVIAPGWAVDDRAAVTFATVFYESFLRGERFGEAVRAARQRSFEENPKANTWAAYHCYGDPGCRANVNRRDEEGTENPTSR